VNNCQKLQAYLWGIIFLYGDFWAHWGNLCVHFYAFVIWRSPDAAFGLIFSVKIINWEVIYGNKYIKIASGIFGKKSRLLKEGLRS
jgi:hypothetical protein